MSINLQEPCQKTFTVSSQAWWGPTLKDVEEVAEKITFGLYAIESGLTYGEMSIAWEDEDDLKSSTLTADSDAWLALSSFGDFLQLLGAFDDGEATPKQVIAALKQCGFTDVTPHQRPLAGPTAIMTKPAP